MWMKKKNLKEFKKLRIEMVERSKEEVVEEEESSKEEKEVERKKRVRRRKRYKFVLPFTVEIAADLTNFSLPPEICEISCEILQYQSENTLTYIGDFHSFVKPRKIDLTSPNCFISYPAYTKDDLIRTKIQKSPYLGKVLANLQKFLSHYEERSMDGIEEKEMKKEVEESPQTEENQKQEMENEESDEEEEIDDDEFQNEGNRSFLVVTVGDWDLSSCLSRECELKGIQFPEFLSNWCDLLKIFRFFHYDLLKVKLDGKEGSENDKMGEIFRNLSTSSFDLSSSCLLSGIRKMNENSELAKNLDRMMKIEEEKITKIGKENYFGFINFLDFMEIEKVRKNENEKLKGLNDCNLMGKICQTIFKIDNTFLFPTTSLLVVNKFDDKKMPVFERIKVNYDMDKEKDRSKNFEVLPIRIIKQNDVLVKNQDFEFDKIQHGYKIVKITQDNEWKELHPQNLGPFQLYDDYQSLDIIRTIEFCKVYPIFMNSKKNPSKNYFLWAKNGWEGKVLDYQERFLKASVSQYYYWIENESTNLNDKKKELSEKKKMLGISKIKVPCKFNEMEMRKRIYIPLYLKSVVKTKKFMELVNFFYKYNGRIILSDEESYDYESQNMSLCDAVEDKTKPFGPSFILKAILSKEVLCDNEEVNLFVKNIDLRKFFVKEEKVIEFEAKILDDKPINLLKNLRKEFNQILEVNKYSK